MEKKYEAPKVEKMDFDYKETVTASSGYPKGTKCDLGGVGVVSAGGWLCAERELDIKNTEGTICGY